MPCAAGEWNQGNKIVLTYARSYRIGLKCDLNSTVRANSQLTCVLTLRGHVGLATRIAGIGRPCIRRGCEFNNASLARLGNIH